MNNVWLVQPRHSEARLTVDNLRGHLVLGDDQVVGDGGQAVPGILVVLVTRHPDHSLKERKFTFTNHNSLKDITTLINSIPYLL